MSLCNLYISSVACVFFGLQYCLCGFFQICHNFCVGLCAHASYVMVCRSGCGICTHDLYSEYMYKGGDRERADCIIVPLNHELPATIDTISNALYSSNVA